MKATLALTCLLTVITAQIGGQLVEQPLQMSRDVLPPVLIKQVRPKFTPRMRQGAGVRDVLVHLTIDSNGVPEHVRTVIREAEFLTADPDFGNSAVEAVQQYRFRPATQKGVPIMVEMNVAVHFDIR